MAMPLRLYGCITALVTPFDESGATDPVAWRRLLDGQLAAGIHGLVVAGSTGEAAMLTAAEFGALIRSAVDAVAGRIPVLAGAGLPATQATIEQCRRARDAGADGLLVATPPYVRPTQEGLRRHFETVAEALDAPIVLYNVPPRTGVDLLPDTVAQLAPDPRIVGIKEAVPDAARIAALLALRSPGFAVLSGDDASACEAQLSGADGVVSVASNVVPAALAALSTRARAGDARGARELNGELAALFPVLALEPNPIPVKAILSQLGLCADRLRLPLVPLSSAHRAAAEAAAREARVLETRFLAKPPQ
jgi:4-hydroxy-tetrahydrodipicolinate synthase